MIFAFDGLKASSFRQYVFQGQGNAPAGSFLRRLARRPEDGGFAYVCIDKAKSIFPSDTIPAWAAVFTGNYPARNGIVSASAYYRDLDVERGYDDFSEDAIHLFGWDWNWPKFPEIACQALPSLLAATGGVAGPDLLHLIQDGMDDVCFWIWRPECWLLHPGFFRPLWPHKECILDFYHSGGMQNGDLLTPTLYDYAAQHGLSAYVANQFYNRTLWGAARWEDVYGSGIKDIDRFWGRPGFRDILDWKLPDPDDNRLFDRRSFDRAMARVTSKDIPAILTLYAAVIDEETHRFRTYGFNSVDAVQLSGLAFADGEITRLVSTIEDQDPDGYRETLFFLIADHGETLSDKVNAISKKVDFPGEAHPDELYRFKGSGCSAHLYINAGKWTDIPTSPQIDTFMNTVMPLATFDEGSKKLIDYVAFCVTRDGKVYRDWDGAGWQVLPLGSLDDREYGFVDGARRIQLLLNPYRAGDVIVVGRRDPQTGRINGFFDSDADHGNLWPEDTYVPFYVWGEPLNGALKDSGSVCLREGNIVDLAPSVMSYLGIYAAHAGEMDGKPVFDEDLRINLRDFERLQEDDTWWETLFGRMVLGDPATR